MFTIEPIALNRAYSAVFVITARMKKGGMTIPKKKPELTIVINTYNRSDLLPKTLAALSRQTLAKTRFEIVIIDDESTDSTPQICKKYSHHQTNARYIRHTHGGLARGRNRGIALAQGELVAFTDDDCIPNQDWAERLLDVYHLQKPAGIEGKIVTDSPAGLFTSAPENGSGGKYTGCNTAYSKKVLNEIGGFDEAFTWFREDSDIAFRVLEKGPILFAPDAIVYHPQRAIAWKSLVTQLKHIRSDIRLFKKMPQKYMEHFGYPAHRNWAQTLLAYSFILAFFFFLGTTGWGVGVIVLLLLYAGIRFFLNMRKRVRTLGEGLLFMAVITLRDLFFPFYFIYYFFTVSVNREPGTSFSMQKKEPSL